MKHYSKLILIGFLFLFIASCNQSKKENQDAMTTIETNIEVEKRDNLLVLNGKERWIANNETTAGIKAMVQLTQSFQHTDDIASYRMLKTQLESELATIFKKCTMKGEAHDQLHNYLLPLQERISKLELSDVSASKSIVEELKMYLLVYENYFV
ncbi:hypothetical protein LX97_00073 [Nonlabens dokdonensis]|uniref:Lipoprotein n=2 Tax=Nonlabens dokdonensis TaxID=328515 RepID=L7W5C5_NONDD|nr:hypothetical protein [Nonlabens dokdonensis]AGC75372.1 hypothetical protein DDD_0245 [Nonlabens dokdonensis DSW-6]PZX43074.1 hypothetical protein LX97_00073 [Nonlabens dokdonensis]